MNFCKKHSRAQISKTGKCYSCQNARDYKSSEWPTSRHKFAQARYAAKRRGVSWTLTYEQWHRIVSLPCAYKFGRRRARTGVDRKNSQLGYSIHNVLPCCARHNRIKSDIFTPNQMREVVKLYKILCGDRGK